MFRIGHHLKILGSIVGTILIDVMHVLRGKKPSPEYSLHNQSVLLNPPTIFSPDPDVSLEYARLCSGVMPFAFTRAVSEPRCVGRFEPYLGPAMKASFRHLLASTGLATFSAAVPGFPVQLLVRRGELNATPRARYPMVESNVPNAAFVRIGLRHFLSSPKDLRCAVALGVTAPQGFSLPEFYQAREVVV